MRKYNCKIEFKSGSTLTKTVNNFYLDPLGVLVTDGDLHDLDKIDTVFINDKKVFVDGKRVRRGIMKLAEKPKKPKRRNVLLDIISAGIILLIVLILAFIL